MTPTSPPLIFHASFVGLLHTLSQCAIICSGTGEKFDSPALILLFALDRILREERRNGTKQYTCIELTNEFVFQTST